MELLNEMEVKLPTLQTALACMFAFIVVDVLTGLLKAIYEKNMDSTKMREGLIKKAMEVVLVIVGHLLAILSSIEQITLIVTVFLCVQETISILENIGTYIRLPKIIMEVLKKLNSKIGEEGDTNG